MRLQIDKTEFVAHFSTQLPEDPKKFHKSIAEFHEAITLAFPEKPKELKSLRTVLASVKAVGKKPSEPPKDTQGALSAASYF